ncbi:MAG: lipocalin-like domain-containing protein [Chthoniobacterales bacterium]
MNRLLTKLAAGDEVKGASGSQKRSVHEVLEDAIPSPAGIMFGATQQFVVAVESCKKSNKQLILSFFFLFLSLQLQAAPQQKISGLVTQDGFSIPQEGHHFSFPRDYGSHDDFKIEWWYITGHLFTKKGKRFGFESTFFATALNPFSEELLEIQSDFGFQTIFFADIALLDVQKKKFLFQRRWNRNGWDASASSEKLDLRNGNWSLVMNDPIKKTIHLSGSIRGEVSLELTLKPLKPLVIFGKNSILRKGKDPENLSYYMTFPRLQVEGTLLNGTQEEQVHGEAWMDHEISTRRLDSNQTGWDWCSLQVKEGYEIMAYRMRSADGTQDPFSTLTWIDPQGKLTAYSGKEFSMEPVSYWKSPTTQIRYPISMRLHTMDPKNNQPVTFLLVPLAENQELVGNNGLSYWEGACRVLDGNNQEVGSAFLELTGYGAGFEKNFKTL